MKTLCPTSPSEPGQRGSQAREPDEKGRVTCFRSSISHDNASLLSMELADIDEVLLIMISVEQIFIGIKIIIFAQ